MKPKIRSTAARSAVLVLLAAAGTAPAGAQTFEAYYGDATNRDAAEDVKAVRNCPGGGSIAAGTRIDTAGVSRAQLTRIDGNGTRLWQFAYRIGDSITSSALGVVEYGSSKGFAVTGHAAIADTRMFVMRVDCDGNAQWTRWFVNQGALHRSIGHDLVELPPTDPLSGGDMLVVGDERTTLPGQSTRGRVARLQGDGDVVFDRAYALPSSDVGGLSFRAVVREPVVPGQPLALTVAGSGRLGPGWATDRRALLFRVREDGAPLCTRLLGSTDSISDDFNGITQTPALSPALPSSVVAVGVSSAESSGFLVSQQPLLVRAPVGSCVPTMQSRWSFPGEFAAATDVDRIISTIAGTPTRLVLSGTVRSNAVPGDAFAAFADVGGLAPLGVSRFGTQAAGIESFAALDLLGNGIVAAGRTERDWDAVGDLRDVYIARAGSTLGTQCSIPWSVTPVNPQLPWEPRQPIILLPPAPEPVQTTLQKTGGQGYCCALLP
jgi:hypothetical protein